MKSIMKKLLLIINPVSGKSALRSQLIEIIDVFIKADYEVTTVVTQSGEHLSKTVTERGAEFDTVVCCGGDGTLNLTVKSLSLLEKKPKLGYIPCGTTNDFAKSRGIESMPLNAARHIANGEEREIDIGFFGERPYVYVAAFGVFSDVSYETPRQLKKNIGHAAYVIEGIKSLGKKNNRRNMTIKIDGKTLSGNFAYGMISNTHRIGGFELPIISDFTLDDGMLDVILIRTPKTADEHTKLINAFITQREDNEIVYKFRSSSFEYECDTEVPWTLDGEYGGSFKERRITLEKKYITMIY